MFYIECIFGRWWVVREGARFAQSEHSTWASARRELRRVEREFGGRVYPVKRGAR
jgi:hypothetical protein